jgi:hypothetical protein
VCCCKWRQASVTFLCKEAEAADENSTGKFCQITLPRSAVNDAVF